MLRRFVGLLLGLGFRRLGLCFGFGGLFRRLGWLVGVGACIGYWCRVGGNFLRAPRLADSDQAWQHDAIQSTLAVTPLAAARLNLGTAHHLEVDTDFNSLGTPGHVEGTIRQAGTLRGVDHFFQAETPGDIHHVDNLSLEGGSGDLGPRCPGCIRPDKIRPLRHAVAIAQFLTIDLDDVAGRSRRGLGAQHECGLRLSATTAWQDADIARRYPIGPYDSQQPETWQQNMQEIRLATRGKDSAGNHTRAWDGVFGLYRQSVQQRRDYVNALPTYGLTGLTSASSNNSSSVAGYGDVIWHATSALDLSAGIRHSKDKASTNFAGASLNAAYSMDRFSGSGRTDGNTTLGKLGEFAALHKLSMFGSLFNAMLPAVLGKKALEGLLEFGRNMNDLEYRARHCLGHEASRTFLIDWLTDIGYEQYLYDSEDSESVAAARWSNVLEFCDWMAQRAGGQIEDAAGTSTHTEIKSLLEVAQNIALLSTISERESEQDQVVLSTLHASKGLEWPHVVLVGVTEGMLPFKLDDDEGRQQKISDDTLQRLQEERRLMYVGITRAQRTLAVSWTKRRKKGREMVAALPSRFIAEMQLDPATSRENPRDKLRQLRAEFAARQVDPT